MEDRYTTWVIASLLLMVTAMTFWLDSIVQPTAPKLDGSTRHDEDYRVENFTSTRMGLDGLPAYTLSAISMVHYPDDDSTHLDRPHFTRYGLGGNRTMHILGQRGEVSRDGKEAFFYDHVKVIRESADKEKTLTMSTSYLHLIPDQEYAETDKPVTIQDAHTIVTAVGLQLNNKTQIAKLLSRVKGHYDNKAH